MTDLKITLNHTVFDTFQKWKLLQFQVIKNPAGLTLAQLEDRIVNPDLRDHSLPGPILNPEIKTGRAPYWASGA